MLISRNFCRVKKISIKNSQKMECFQIKSNKNRTIMITLGRNHFHLFTHNSGHILVLPEIMSLNEN